MTDEMMNLRALVEKVPNADILRDMMPSPPNGWWRWRSASRTGTFETRAGPVELRIPKLRQGSYFPSFLLAAADGGEGADRGDPGSLHPGRLDPGRSKAMGGTGDRKIPGSAACARRSTRGSKPFSTVRSRATAPAFRRHRI